MWYKYEDDERDQHECLYLRAKLNEHNVPVSRSISFDSFEDEVLQNINNDRTV